MRNILILLALALCGCPLLLGKTYERVAVPATMGVIYLYAGPKSKSLQNVHVDKTPATDGVTETVRMVKKGYFPYLVQPGLVRVVSGPENDASCVLLAVQSGSSHWVRVTSTTPRVVAVPQDEAEAEMGAYREISRESLSKATGNYPSDDCPMPAEQDL